MAVLLAVLAVLAALMELLKARAVLRRGAVISDAFSYLRAAREVRKGRPLSECLSFFCPGRPEPLNLPPLQVLALAPLGPLGQAAAVIVPLVEHVATAGVVFAFAWRFAGLAAAGLAAACYLLTPAASMNTVSLTPRPLGVLFGAFACLFAWRYMEGADGLVLAGAAAACAAGLLAHRMTAQALILLVPACGVAGLFIRPAQGALLLAVIPAALALAWVVTRGAYGGILRDHWRRVLYHVRHGSQNEGRKALTPVRKVLAANPWLLLGAWMMARGLLRHQLADALPLLIFAGGSLALSFAWVWGGGHRHVMFSAAPVAVLTALALPGFAGLDWAAGGLCLAASLVVLARSIHAVGSPVPVQKAISDDARRCMSYLATQEPGVVLVLPDVAYPPLVYYTDHRILSAGHGLEALTFNRDYLKPVAATAGGLREVLRRYPVDWLLVLRDGLGVPGCWPAPRPDGGVARPPAPREVFRSGTCAVYRCVPASCADGTSDSTAPNAALARSSRELEWQRLR